MGETFAAAIVAAPQVVTGPISLAILAAAGIVLAFWGVVTLQQPGLVAQRLGNAAPVVHSLEDLELQIPFSERVLQPIMRGCSRLVLRYTPTSTIESYRRRLVLAGSTMEVRDFLGIKGLLALGLGGGYFLLSAAFGIGAARLPIVVTLALIGFYGPNIHLRGKIKKRQLEIQRSLPDALDLLTICVEAGLGFDGAIGRVVEKHDNALSYEFGRVLTEMRMGRARRDALRTLAERTDVPDVNTFISAIIQSEQLGVSISRVLLTQAEQMRIKRRQRAEEAAHKAPIKMLFPLVFLIFPSMYIVILGPAIPGILKAFPR